MLIDAGNYHNPNDLESFLKKLRPADEAKASTAAWFYKKALELGNEEAENNLKNLCEATEDPLERLLIDDCGIIADE